MFKGMEYTHKFISIIELDATLESLSDDGWEVVSISTVHANTFELAERASVLAVLKRPKRKNEKSA